MAAVDYRLLKTKTAVYFSITSLTFLFSIASFVISGALSAYFHAKRPRRAGTVPIDDSALCLRLTRHSDFVQLDAMMGTPAVTVPILLRLDSVKLVGDPHPNMRLFGHEVLQSRSVNCSSHSCNDVVLLTDFGGRQSFYNIRFEYTHSVVEASLRSSAFQLGLKGELFLQEGFEYWISQTELCFSRSNQNSGNVRVFTSAGAIVTDLTAISTSEILSQTPVVQTECNATSITLFPVGASVERSWLSLADTSLYNQPVMVNARRTIAEIGTMCASQFEDMRRELRLYLLDCTPYGSCRTSLSIPFRRFATLSIYLNIATSGNYSLSVMQENTLYSLASLANDLDAFLASVLKMMMTLVAASVVFVRSRRKTASSSWLIKNCIRISKQTTKEPMTQEHSLMEDAIIGFVAFSCRFVVSGARLSGLSSDGQLRVCIAEFVGATLSMVHWILRYSPFGLSHDPDEAPISKLGGSMALIDSTAAVMLAFSDPPILATSTASFNNTARMLVSVLICVIVTTRCAFSAACCGIMWPTFQSTDRRDYQIVLVYSSIAWCIQGAVLGITVCDLFVSPATHSIMRSTAANPVDFFVARLVLFLALVSAGLPRMMNTCRHILSKDEHVD